MKRILLLLLISLLIGATSEAQKKDFPEALYASYPEFKEAKLENRRFKHAQVDSLLQELKAYNSWEIRKVGESLQGRSLNLLSMGDGKVDVFLWSQMHGDESTATMAIFDILNFFRSNQFEKEKEEMLQNLRIHFLPMLNPDGAEKFTRRNALGIDVNRDALRLQSPEAKTLKRVRDSLEAEFGFNLHDQSKYYNAERTEKPATISFLAPAYNYEKEINAVRGDAMKVIVKMNETLQRFAPGQVGRYNDDFEPRAFGDNIQKWGTSTILIESGGYPGDPEKQEIRKLNFVSILAALNSIANGSFKDADISEYEEIPNNDRMLFDLKLTALSYELNEEEYILDLGINRAEHDLPGNSDFYYSGRIVDQGDLSTSYGYEQLDASGMEFELGKIYPEVVSTREQLEKIDYADLLENGFAFLMVVPGLLNKAYSSFPVNLVSKDFKVDRELNPGKDANFFLKENGEIRYAVINGFLTDLNNPGQAIRNTLIIK